MNATARVIVGVTTSPVVTSKNGVSVGLSPAYAFDVQMNNARTAPVRVLSHAWRVESDAGEALVDGADIDEDGRGPTTIGPDDAIRFAGKLQCLDPKRGCVAEGHFRVLLADTGEIVDLNTGEFALRPSCGRS